MRAFMKTIDPAPNGASSRGWKPCNASLSSASLMYVKGSGSMEKGSAVWLRGTTEREASLGVSPSG